MENFKFELGEEVKIKTSMISSGIILARGKMESIDGGRMETYLVFFGGEKRAFLSEFELEKKK